MQKIKFIFISLRPKQWVKNLFIFLPLLFYGGLINKGYLLNTSLFFVYFTLAASGVYLLNDILDRDEDKIHPLKSKRPVAQGAISASLAGCISLLLFAASLSGAAYTGNSCLVIIILVYIALNILYTLFIKHITILDVICIAIGFELRIWAGAVAIDIEPSAWLQICTFLLALFLGFAKRKGEILSLDSSAAQHRKALAGYQPRVLEQLILLCSGLIIVAYILYVLSWGLSIRPRGNFMIYTVIFVVYGIFRYLYLINTRRYSGDPTEILVSDMPLAANLAAWFLCVFTIIYL